MWLCHYLRIRFKKSTWFSDAKKIFVFCKFWYYSKESVKWIRTIQLQGLFHYSVIQKFFRLKHHQHSPHHFSCSEIQWNLSLLPERVDEPCLGARIKQLPLTLDWFVHYPAITKTAFTSFWRREQFVDNRSSNLASHSWLAKASARRKH